MNVEIEPSLYGTPSESLPSPPRGEFEIETWVSDMESKLVSSNNEARRREEPPTIFKVPEILRGIKPNDYDPKMVALGPYHHQKPPVPAMNELKWHLLNKLLAQNPGMALRDYLRLVKRNANKARDAYAEPLDMSEDDLVQILLLDCAFVIMNLRQWNMGDVYEPEAMLRSQDLLGRDMLLLENQLPFFLLQTLFDSAFPNGVRSSQLKTWVVELFRKFAVIQEREPDHREQFHHILHLFHSRIVPRNGSTRSGQNESGDQLADLYLRRIHRATRLKETGIEFKRREAAFTVLDVSFKDGKLEIPRIEVDDDTDVLFRNLIAFEQCYGIKSTDVGAYASLMSCIVNTPDDVELLQTNEIIASGLGSNKEVANLFHRLCKEVVVNHDKSYISSVYKEVQKHCDADWNKWRADLRHKFFRSPWSLCSLVAAIVIFLITIAQLVVSILNRGCCKHL